MKTDFYDSDNPRCDYDKLELLRKYMYKEQDKWNDWRKKNPDEEIYMQGIEISAYGATIFKNLDLSRIHFEGASFSCSRFEDVDLSGAYCDNANFEMATFTNVKFFRISLKKANFSSAEFNRPNLNKIKFDETIFIDTKFINPQMNETYFINAKIQHADLTKASLIGAIFEDSDLNYAKLNSIRAPKLTLNNVRFNNVDLNEAVLGESCITDSCFWEANLTNASLYKTKIRHMKLEHASIEKAIFNRADIIGFLCSGTSFAKCIFTETTIQNANFRETNFRNAIFKNANIKESSFSKANLDGTMFEKTNFNKVDFSKALVSATTLLDEQCTIDRDINFTTVGLDSARISPSLLTALKTNIRRKEWEKYYKGCSYPKRQILRFFWWLSDYGSSSSRILFAFLLSILTFAFIYSLIELAAPNILSNIKHLESPTPLLNYLFIAIQSLCFALSTMVTLGFANININVSNLQPIWSILGLFCVSLNLLTGYFLLAVLVTRLGILFQSLAPEQEQIAATNKTELDDYIKR